MRKLLFLLAFLPVFAYGQATKTSATFDHVRARASLRIGSGSSTAATGIANVMPATPGTQLITAAGVYNWFTGTITFAGDIAGPYNNLQIGTGTVGTNELASTTVTAGTYGSASLVPVVTVDADGRVTGMTTAAVSGGGGGGAAIPANRVPYGNPGGTDLASEAAYAYNPTLNQLTVDTVRSRRIVAAIWDRGVEGAVYHVAAYNIFPNGSDMTARFRSLLDTVKSRGGGTIQFGQGAYVINGQITIPFDLPLTAANPGAYDRQPTVRIKGVGCYKTCWNTNPTSIKGTTLLLGFNDGLPNRDTIGMIHARGAGFLEISDLNLQSDDTTKTAFILINYTTTHIHNVAFWGSGVLYNAAQAQDAIVCGGDVKLQVVNQYNTHFAGYGSVFENNYFYGIRRGWYARAYTNNVVFQNNTFWYANRGPAAVELYSNITGNVVGGNLISGNTAEVDGYQYFAKLGYGANANTIIGNGIYDPTAATDAFIKIDSFAESNQIIAGYWDTGRFLRVNGDRQYVRDRNTIVMNNIADTTTFGSSLQIGGDGIAQKSFYAKEGLYIKDLEPLGIRLIAPGALTNWFGFNADASRIYLSSNLNNKMASWDKNAPEGSYRLDQYGGSLFNRTAFNDNNGSYIHPDGRAIFKQSVYINRNWDGLNDYQLDVSGNSRLNGTLEMSTTTGVLYPPRMTTAQRNAIAGVTAGGTVYCTDATATDGSTGVMQTYNGTTWKNNW